MRLREKMRIKYKKFTYGILNNIISNIMEYPRDKVQTGYVYMPPNIEELQYNKKTYNFEKLQVHVHCTILYTADKEMAPVM